MAELDSTEEARQDTVLKLLSGPQSGAEIWLSEGQYLIGTADEADIVLQDDAVAAQHAALGIHGTHIRIEPRELPVAIGDRVIPLKEIIDASAPVVIGLGSTHVAIGPVGTDWAALERPHAAKQEAGEEQEQADGETEPVTVPIEPEPVVESGEQTPSRGRLRLSPRWGWAIAPVLIIVALLVFRHDLMAWRDKAGSDSKPRAELSTLDRANSILENPALKGVRASATKDNTIVLQGYCKTESCKNRVTTEFSSAGIAFENRIWVEQLLKNSLNETLERFGERDIKFDYLGDGAVRLRGFLVAEHRKEELLDTLRNDVPGISRIDTAQLKKISQAAAMLREGVREAGLESKLKIKVNGARLMASGNLDPTLMIRWQQTSQAFAEKTKGLPPLDSKVKLVSDARPATVLKKTGITIIGVMVTKEDPPFAAAILANGAILSEGDKIDGEYVIKQIDFDRVVLWNGETESVYHVGGM